MEDTKAEIFNYGKELFSSKGFKDTKVSDITKMTGIGVGKFYKYYISKEQLFIEIFLDENEKLKRSIMELVDLDDDPIKMVKIIIDKNICGIKSNPILKEWYNRDFFGKLEKEFYKQGGLKSINDLMNSSTLEMIRHWKAKGKLRSDLEDDFILAIFTSIPYIDVHKDEIGIQHFPRILECLEEFIMKGLTQCHKE